MGRLLASLNDLPRASEQRKKKPKEVIVISLTILNRLHTPSHEVAVNSLFEPRDEAREYGDMPHDDLVLYLKSTAEKDGHGVLIMSF
jgi:hypothetical protein